MLRQVQLGEFPLRGAGLAPLGVEAAPARAAGADRLAREPLRQGLLAQLKIIFWEIMKPMISH